MNATGLIVLRRTRRYEKLIRFYRDHLGMVVLREWHNPGNDGAMLSFGPAVPDLKLEVLSVAEHPEPPDRPANLELNILVDDPDAWHEQLVAAGVPIARGLQDMPWGHRNFGVVDPDGLQIWFYKLIQPAG